MIIAIDGPAGTGKGTISKLLAQKFGYILLDTGAMYRCIALKMLREKINLDEIDRINDLLNRTNISFKDINGVQRTFLDDEDVSEKIREKEVNEFVSPASTVKEIRIKLVDLQRDIAKQGDIVAEGRDMTTVVFPEAEVKIYLTASLEERAMRRYKEMISKFPDTKYEEVYENIKNRDKRDMEKEMGALKIADNAIVVDSTDLSIEEVFDKIKNIIINAQ
jgi:cytidylate kinase